MKTIRFCILYTLYIPGLCYRNFAQFPGFYEVVKKLKCKKYLLI